MRIHAYTLAAVVGGLLGLPSCHVYDPYLLPDAPRADATGSGPDTPLDQPPAPDAPAGDDAAGADAPDVPVVMGDAPGPDAPPPPPDVVVVDVPPDAPPLNLLTNGSFDGTDATTWSDGWFFQSVMPAMGTLAQDTTQHFDGRASAHITVSAIDAMMTWHVQIGHGGVAAEMGRQYTVTFAGRAVPSRSIDLVFQRASTPYTSYYVRTVMLDSTWRSFTLTPGNATETVEAMVVFNFADVMGEVWIDAVRMTTP